MEIIANPQLLNLATKYAFKMNKKMLGEKLMELAAKIMNDPEDDSPSFEPVSVRFNFCLFI